MDAKFVSETLLMAAADFLKNCPMKLLVSFVVIPDQRNVFDAFTASLKTISRDFHSSTGVLRSGQSLRYTSKSNHFQPSVLWITRTERIFDISVTTISLFAASPSVLNECETRIKEYVAKITETISVQNSSSLANWTDSTLENYYKSCIEVDVLPNIDLSRHTITLVGLKEDVSVQPNRIQW